MHEGVNPFTPKSLLDLKYTMFCLVLVYLCWKIKSSSRLEILSHKKIQSPHIVEDLKYQLYKGNIYSKNHILSA